MADDRFTTHSELFDLSGKCALVTGGTRGIGMMIARGLLQAGARVVVSSRKADACAEAQRRLAEFGDVRAIPADLSRYDECRRLAELVQDDWEHLDVLVNNAGAMWREPLETFPAEAWDAVLDVNLKSPFWLVQALLPALLRAGGADDPARIINIGSIAAIHVAESPNYSYASSKAALHQLTRVLARELGPQHVTVNAVAPGVFPSQMMASTIDAVGDGVATIDPRTEIKEFLSSRRARITPERAGLPACGGHRRVKGLRREEVALLAGVSVDYYVRMERGSLAGASDGVLDALAAALRLDEAERDHLFHLARRSRSPGGGPRRPRRPAATVRPALQQVLDASTDAPAWICNGRYDVLATNRLARALYSPLLADARRPANTARFVYLELESARSFFVDHDRIARDVAAKLRMETGRDPHNEELIALVGELFTRSELFRGRWASQDVRLHRSGRKRLHHPVVGRLDLDVESMELPTDPGLLLNVYTAPAGTATSDGLALLASWAAGQEQPTTETGARG